MSYYDMSPADVKREEQINESHAIAREMAVEGDGITTHTVAATSIGSWRVEIEEAIYDDNGELAERTWTAWRLANFAPIPKREEKWADDLMQLVDAIIADARRAGWKDDYNTYLIVGDLMHQANAYWQDKRKESAA